MISKLTVLDLEATCWDLPTAHQKDNVEIIEIAAINFNLYNLQAIQASDSFQSLVKPDIYPCLSNYCTKLTGITQDMVDSAPSFCDIGECLKNFIDRKTSILCAWGPMDKKLLEKECDRYRVSRPFDERYLDFKKFLEDYFGYQFGSLIQTMRLFGIEYENTYHRAITDARNLYNLIFFFCKSRDYLNSIMRAI
jgi:3'-5' exoribonuclease 1